MSSDPAAGRDTLPRTREVESDDAGAISERPDPPPLSRRCNVILLSLVSLWTIGFGVWLVSAGKRYREEYAQATEGWRVGSTRAVELTLVKDDKQNLACRSDQVIAGLRCAYAKDSKESPAASTPNRETLQPYNTTKSELLLGAGLWDSPQMRGTLPRSRFTVFCNYTVKGILKSGSIRFNPADSFSPLQKTVTAGTLTDCVLPK
jgi:hypothetical protein